MRQHMRGAVASVHARRAPRVDVTRLVLAARSFLHGRPFLNRWLAGLARPVLRHIPQLQSDPALDALARFAQAAGPVMFVQLGAHDGLANDPLHDFVMSRPDWSGLVVEPAPDHFAALQMTYAAISGRIRFERSVVSDSSGHAAFYRLRDSPGLPAALRQVGSLSRAHVEEYAASVQDPSLVVQEQVASTTLPALLERQGIAAIDLLHMDIEGAEPLVLAQIDFDAPWAPRALLFEHNHLSTADFRHWKSQLRLAGYALEHGRQDTWAARPS
jgi:FkbM family methyltransferase